jgi:hypothetical protein
LDSKVSSKKDVIRRKKRGIRYIIDETVIKAGSENIWLWMGSE